MTFSKTQYTTQYMDNWSFDDTYKQNTVEILAEDNSNNVLKKVQADPSGNLKVNVAAGGTFAVQETTYSTSSVTSVAGSDTSVQLLASTAGRRGAYFYNDSSAICYLKLGTTASTSSFTVAMAANSFYELPYPCYTGRIDAIWASATGNMRITEIT